MKDQDILVIEEPKLTTGQRMFFTSILRGLWTTLRHFFGRKVTVQYPEERRPLRVQNHRAFHRLNLDDQGRLKCVACLMCETICPARCISIEAMESPWPDREKYPESFVIDELRCIFCGMCEEACPVAAIELTPLFEPVSYTREEMMFDQDKLIEVYHATQGMKPYKQPRIVGYDTNGDSNNNDEKK
ncbi:MAG: NADH-quinone oxidoreductase subunit I [Phycisphaerae bacterium]|nr:NADH-quinone oxidoreductase subunit I [Phycisphaerae bacterium]